jgi:monofunctional glycosyltransferase
LLAQKDFLSGFFINLLKILLFIHIGVVFIVLIFCLTFRVKNPTFGTLMLYRKIFYKYDVKPIKFIALKKIPVEIRNMIIDIEDSNFYNHMGIDILAMEEAYIRNQKMHRQFYGGSTITQQLARTLFLIPKKNFIRKYFEIIIAVEMDLILTKNRILELYLNSIEWGKGIFGIERASYSYYNKSVQNLNTEEMVRLVTILSSPVKYNPDNFYRLRILAQRYDSLKAIIYSNQLQAVQLSNNLSNAVEEINKNPAESVNSTLDALAPSNTNTETSDSFLSETNAEPDREEDYPVE